MNFDEFESQARLYIVGALEGDELAAFQATRRVYGERAEQIIAEFRKLNSVFALSLQPHAPHPETKRKLLQAIRKSAQEGQPGRNGNSPLGTGTSRFTP